MVQIRQFGHMAALTGAQAVVYHVVLRHVRVAAKGRIKVPYLTPTLVKRVGPTQTDITWNDGHFSSYPSWYLREKCPCASCVEEFSGVRRIVAGSIPSTLERVSVKPVGNYALSFGFSDRHTTGIYTFDYLRSICACPQCLPEGLKEPPAVVRPPGSFEA